MASTSKIKNENICRTCMGREELLSLYEIAYDTMTLDLIISAVTGIKIEQGDGLPSTICLKCKEQATTAYDFRRKTQSADITLRDLLKEGRIEMKLDETYEYCNQIKTELNLLVDQDQCLDEWTTLDGLEDMAIVKNENDSHYECKNCTDVFESYKKYQEHLRKKCVKVEIDDSSNNYCPLCGTYYYDAVNLTKHMWDCHTELMGPKKRGRPRKLMTGAILSKLTENGFHLKSVHVRKYSCTFCGEEFETKEDIHTHLMEHKVTDTSGSGTSEVDGAQKETIRSIVKNVAVVKDSATSGGESSVVSCFSADRSIKEVLLATALVGVETHKGMQTIRAILDQGSQASFVTEATVQFLGLRKTSIKGFVSGIGGNSELCAKSMVEFNIHSVFDKNVVITVKAYVLNSITSFLPSKTVTRKWEEFNDLQLADPQFNIPSKINILLGADIYGIVIREGIRRGSRGTPIAQATSLGWIISGAVKEAPENSTRIVVMHASFEENNMLKQFWELESDVSLNQDRIQTIEEQKCEQIFTETTYRDSEGRYVVKLPLRNSIKDLSTFPSDSRKIAEKRLLSLEARLAKNKDLKKEYKKVIDEYLELGHMELVPESEKDKEYAVYLPHHAVVKLERETTKVRVVFDASCKGNNGISLNEALMIGPTLQPELRHIILRWRTFPITMTADIVKMYRQIKVNEEHVDLQRLLWRDEETSEIKDYRLLRVTFGTASAPYLAVRALQQVANDEGGFDVYPTASERVKRDYYMDDLMSGVATDDEGVKLFQEMNTLLHKGGFKLQKWSSNNNTLLEKLKEVGKDKEAYVEDVLHLKMDSTIKILGLTWCREEDSFKYVVKLTPPKIPATKRSIISDISRLFDPLGWVTPCIVIAKIIIQKLWLTGLDWDEEVPENLVQEWFKYREELLQLNKLNLPRWYNTYQTNKVMELHGFSDASKLAYAAAVYIRSVDKGGNVHVVLVSAKSG